MAKTNPTQLGTDNLKKILAFLLLTVNMILALAKNFSYPKALSLAFHIGENLSILDVGRVALAEFRDLTVEESRDVAAFLGREFDIEDNNLEARIENGINLLPQGYALLKQNIAFYQQITDFVQDFGTAPDTAVPRLEGQLRKLDLAGVRVAVSKAA